MKALAAILILFAWASAHGWGWDYFSSRKWIEQQCVTNGPPAEQRLFVGRAARPQHAAIVQFRKGITLREIIDTTPFKGKTVQVCVMRPHTIAKSGSTFTRHEYITMGPSDTPDYELHTLDVIWLYNPGVIIVR